MRLGGRLAAAMEVLEDIDRRKRPVADALKDWGLAHRFAGSGDRAAIGNIVYDALRMKASHAWLMDSEAPAAMVHAVMMRQWGMTPEGLAAQLEGDDFAPPALDADALGAFAARDLADAPEDVQADIPGWLVASFKENFSEEWLVEAQALATRPPLDLRVNTLKADRDKVAKALARTGAAPTAIARHGLRIAPVSGAGRHPNVTSELAFQKGWFEIQDEGSQIVADLVFPKAGEQILDFCAGGGGKTLALSAALANKGQVHAYDADRGRLAPIIERLKRAGTRNVQVHDSLDALVPLVGRMDRVVVDAPCTGTGTWRRRPDTKWRLSEATLEERLRQQDEVLAQASAYVRPGGYLVYITCSVLPEENEGQVYGFCEDNPAFELVSAAEAWEELFGSDKPTPWSADMKTVTLTPASTGTDGFFLAVMERRG